MPKAYEKKDLIKITDAQKLSELDKFVFNNIGNGKVFKLREILQEFEPMYLIVQTTARGRKYLLRLRTYDFPADEENGIEEERRVGIEFVKEIE